MLSDRSTVLVFNSHMNCIGLKQSVKLWIVCIKNDRRFRNLLLLVNILLIIPL